MYNAKTRLLSKKAEAIDNAFCKLQNFLEGKTSKETLEIQALKKIIGNYSIQNYDCYAQADHLFKVDKRTCIFYKDFSTKIQNWLHKLVGIFKEYEAKKKCTPLLEASNSTQLVIQTNTPTIQDNPRMRWYFDDCAEEREA